MSYIRFVPLTAAAALLALAGCAGGGPQFSEVEGMVTLKGAPIDKIHIEFWPETNGPRSIGITDAQGRFTLMTDDGKHTGAVVGPHKIVLRDTLAIGEKFLGRAGDGADLRKTTKPARISNQYGDPHKSPLKRDVTPGKCVIEIPLTS